MEEFNCNRLIRGVEKTVYLFEPIHCLLSKDSLAAIGPTIGKNGRNLTISFLSLNRSTLSIRLLRSITEHIPHFAGEVIIIDNGSSASELLLLKEFCNTLTFKSVIVELGSNYGVGGGRNRTLPYVNTEWVMFLDNDIYLIANPLPLAQENLATFGCHFMNLPLLDKDNNIISAGGHFYIWPSKGKHRTICRSALKSQKYDDRIDRFFFSTFLSGGCCIINKATFQKTGGYDEAMFVGYEDLDLSIRLFQAGFKIGNSGCYALVHDHTEPTSELDKKYELIRWSLETIKKSADYFEKKHNLVVWDDSLIDWINSKQ
jgi:GT2 family glycosyltransferase